LVAHLVVKGGQCAYQHRGGIRIEAPARYGTEFGKCGCKGSHVDLYNPNRRLCRPVLYNRRNSDPSRATGGAVGVVRAGAIGSSFAYLGFCTPEMCRPVATSGHRCAAIKRPRIVPHTRGDARVLAGRDARAPRPFHHWFPLQCSGSGRPLPCARVQNPKMWDVMRAVREGNEEWA
jgi:hypothetical protein